MRASRTVTLGHGFTLVAALQLACTAAPIAERAPMRPEPAQPSVLEPARAPSSEATAKPADAQPSASAAETPELDTARPRPEPAAPPSLDGPSPRLLAFVRAIAPWDAQLERELNGLELRGSARAGDDEVTQQLELRLLREISLAALARSHDRTLRSLRAQLESVTPSSDEGHAHRNLTMGPSTPWACEPCEYEPTPKCVPPRCALERSYLGPAVISAGGLGAEMTFAGHPQATDDGVSFTDGFTLLEFLQAAEAAGLERRMLRERLLGIVSSVAKRSRLLGAQAEPSLPAGVNALPAALLSAGAARWRAVHAPSSKDRIAWELPTAADDAARALWEAVSDVEKRLLAAHASPALSRYLRQAGAYRRETARFERALAQGSTEPLDFPESVSVDDPCGAMNGRVDEAKLSACQALFAVSTRFDALAQDLRASSAQTSIELEFARILEELSWLGWSEARIDALLGAWLHGARARARSK